MSYSPYPHRENFNTYFVQDRSSEEEIVRLQAQDQMFTLGMSGVLAEQSNPTRFRRVLDVGCGTGGWLIEAARTYPHMSMLIGVDINKKMVDYARSQAAAQQVSDRVEFHMMDALRMLEFPDKYFDLINQRLGMSYLRTWDWPKLLEEYWHATRSGGVIRITESATGMGNSAALTQIGDLLVQAFCQAGHFFTSTPDGVTGQLERLLRQRGLQNVQTHAYTMEYRTGTPEWQLFFEDMKRAFRTAMPFMRKWVQLPDDYEAIYQQALSDMQQPDFVVIWPLLTAWGIRP